jgi:hypothetical protein
MVSSTSRLLDYLILRDHARVTDGCIDFRPDGIRFETLTATDLEGHAFGVHDRAGAFAVHVNGEPVPCHIAACGDGIYLVTFSSAVPERCAVPAGR